MRGGVYRSAKNVKLMLRANKSNGATEICEIALDVHLLSVACVFGRDIREVESIYIISV